MYTLDSRVCAVCCQRHSGDKQAFHFSDMLLFGHYKRREEIPEVVVFVFWAIGVCPYSIEQDASGLADVVGMIVSIKNIHSRFGQKVSNIREESIPLFDIEDFPRPHLGTL